MRVVVTSRNEVALQEKRAMTFGRPNEGYFRQHEGDWDLCINMSVPYIRRYAVDLPSEKFNDEEVTGFFNTGTIFFLNEKLYLVIARQGSQIEVVFLANEQDPTGNTVIWENATIDLQHDLRHIEAVCPDSSVHALSETLRDKQKPMVCFDGARMFFLSGDTTYFTSQEQRQLISTNITRTADIEDLKTIASDADRQNISIWDCFVSDNAISTVERIEGNKLYIMTLSAGEDAQFSYFWKSEFLGMTEACHYVTLRALGSHMVETDRHPLLKGMSRLQQPPQAPQDANLDGTNPEAPASPVDPVPPSMPLQGQNLYGFFLPKDALKGIIGNQPPQPPMSSINQLPPYQPYLFRGEALECANGDKYFCINVSHYVEHGLNVGLVYTLVRYRGNKRKFMAMDNSQLIGIVNAKGTRRLRPE